MTTKRTVGISFNPGGAHVRPSRHLLFYQHCQHRAVKYFGPGHPNPLTASARKREVESALYDELHEETYSHHAILGKVAIKDSTSTVDSMQIKLGERC